MKTLFLFISLFVCSFYSNAQSEELSVLEDHKWTARTFLLGQSYTYSKVNPLPSFFTGVGLKYNLKKISFRLSYEQSSYIYDVIEPNFSSFPAYTGANSEHALRAGAAYRKVYEGRIAVSFFLDYLFADYRTNRIFYDQFKQPYHTLNTKGNSHGAIIGIGVDYFLTPNLSVAFESRLDLLHFNINVERLEHSKDFSVKYFTQASDVNLRIIGNLSFNYHF